MAGFYTRDIVACATARPRWFAKMRNMRSLRTQRSPVSSVGPRRSRLAVNRIPDSAEGEETAPAVASPALRARLRSPLLLFVGTLGGAVLLFAAHEAIARRLFSS